MYMERIPNQGAKGHERSGKGKVGTGKGKKKNENKRKGANKTKKNIAFQQKYSSVQKKHVKNRVFNFCFL